MWFAPAGATGRAAAIRLRTAFTLLAINVVYFLPFAASGFDEDFNDNEAFDDTVFSHHTIQSPSHDPSLKLCFETLEYRGK